MIGILIELIVSWLLLRIIERKPLSVLGLSLTKSRARDFAIGLCGSALCCAIYHLVTTAFAGITWTLNEQTSGQMILTGSWWTLKSVLFEELIFRGALLYIALQKFGAKIACLLSAIAFGVYHWFSFGALGNPAQMTFIFFMTGVWGIMFAGAFTKTESLYLPMGLHWGWNFVSTVVFSQGPLGPQLLINTGGRELNGLPSLLIFSIQVFALPLMVYFYLKRYTKEPNPDEPKPKLY